MALRCIVAFVAMSALVAGAFSISCYTISATVVVAPDLTSTTFPRILDSGSNFSSCVNVKVDGSLTVNSTVLEGAGMFGEGTACTCADWNGATGCNGVTRAQLLAARQADLITVMTTLGSNVQGSVTDFTCCETDLCNTGAGFTLNAATLPLANMVTLVATALVGYIFTAKLL